MSLYQPSSRPSFSSVVIKTVRCRLFAFPSRQFSRSRIWWRLINQKKAESSGIMRATCIMWITKDTSQPQGVLTVGSRPQPPLVAARVIDPLIYILPQCNGEGEGGRKVRLYNTTCDSSLTLYFMGGCYTREIDLFAEVHKKQWIESLRWFLKDLYLIF